MPISQFIVNLVHNLYIDFCDKPWILEKNYKTYNYIFQLKLFYKDYTIMLKFKDKLLRHWLLSAVTYISYIKRLSFQRFNIKKLNYEVKLHITKYNIIILELTW